MRDESNSIKNSDGGQVEDVTTVPEAGRTPSDDRGKRTDRRRRTIVVTALVTAGVTLGASSIFLRWPTERTSGHDGVSVAIPELYYYDMAPILVNLRQLEGARAVLLKMTLRLEVGHKTDLDLLKVVAPRVKDDVQAYLRDMTLEDLSSEGMLTKMKEEMLTRVNALATPVQVHAVLIKDMIMQ